MAEELAKIDTTVQVKEPNIAAGKRMSFADVMGVQEPFLKKRGEIREEIKATEGEILAGQQRQKEVGAEGKMTVEQQTAGEIRGAQQRFQQRMQQEPLPAFIPTQDNFRDIAGLFSLIGVVGMVAGKSSGLAAMNAMNGMVEGYRAGRNDLYRREREVFDKNFKTMLQKHGEFRKEMDDSVKLAQTNRQAGLQAAELAAVKAGSPIVLAQVKAGNLMGAMQTVDDGLKAANTAVTLQNTNINAEVAARERAAQAAQASAQRAQEAERARQQRNVQLIQTPEGVRSVDVGEVPRITPEQLATATPFKGGGKGGGLKADAKERNAYIADNVLLADINDMKNDLKNPRLYEQIKQYRIEAFLTEEGKVLDQLLSEELPRELQVFLTKVRDVRNNYYLDKSGKTVTGAEALRNYGTVPQSGDSPERMQDKFDGLAGRVKRTISIRQQMYGLPPIKVNAGDPTKVNPGEEIPLRFNTEEEVDEANLEPGTLVIVGKRRGRVQPKQTQ